MYVSPTASATRCLGIDIRLLRWSFVDLIRLHALVAGPVIGRCEAWVRERLLLLPVERLMRYFCEIALVKLAKLAFKDVR